MYPTGWRMSLPWSHISYPSMRGEGDNRSQNRNALNNSRNETVITEILPHRSSRTNRNNARSIILTQETSRSTTPCNFFLCFCSLVLFASGVALVGTSLWILLTRIPYLYLIDHLSYFGITSFTFCAGLLCFPACWLTCAPYSRHHGWPIPLLILFICVSTILLGTGTCIGITYQSHVSFNWVKENVSYSHRSFYRLGTFNNYLHIRYGEIKSYPVLQPGPFRSAINGNMIESQYMYDTKTTYRLVWDTTQSRLHCCGVNEPSDWLKIRDQLPTTCCEQMETNQHAYCLRDMTYGHGCLDLIAFDLFWHMSLLTGIAIIVLFMQLITLIIATYICLKIYPNQPVISSRVLYPNASYHNTPLYAFGNSTSMSATAPPPSYNNSGLYNPRVPPTTSTFTTNIPNEMNINNQAAVSMQKR